MKTAVQHKRDYTSASLGDLPANVRFIGKVPSEMALMPRSMLYQATSLPAVV